MCPQRALLEQKQKKKRQEPLMVQANADGRPRSRRARQSEEQAPLVESYVSSSGSTGYQGRAARAASRRGLRPRWREAAGLYPGVPRLPGCRSRAGSCVLSADCVPGSRPSRKIVSGHATLGRLLPRDLEQVTYPLWACFLPS